MKIKSCLIFLISFVSLYALSSQRVSDNFKGEGLYSWYFLDVYTAKLWANSTKLYEDNLSLELTYLRSLDGEDIAKRSVKEMINLGFKDFDAKGVEQALIKIFPDVEKGDKILANYTPQKGLVFIFNGNRVLGKLDNIETSQRFLDIWLHKNTSAKQLRAQLIGNKSE